jgi:hypothetical protein
VVRTAPEGELQTEFAQSPDPMIICEVTQKKIKKFLRAHQPFSFCALFELSCKVFKLPPLLNLA